MPEKKKMQKDMIKKFLPIGVQNFAQMINGNFVYVDKTRYVYELARVPQAFYFLSRPRRFGKSLLVSTFKALFEGRKDLFKGLWVENSDWDWKPHPVVNIDFNGIDATNATLLQESLSIALDKIAELHEVALPERREGGDGARVAAPPQLLDGGLLDLPVPGGQVRDQLPEFGGFAFLGGGGERQEAGGRETLR